MNDIYVGKFTGSASAVDVACGFIPEAVIFLEATVPSLAVSFVDGANGVNVTAAAAAPSAFLAQFAGEPQHYELTGTFAVTVDTVAVVGTSTLFTTELELNQHVVLSGVAYEIVAIASATAMTLGAAVTTVQSGTKGQRLEGKPSGFTVPAAHEANTSGEIDFIAMRGDR